jgi:hypothetical protein
MISIPHELLEQIQRGNVVVLCGAGVSSSEGGLPSGSQLAQELAQRAALGDVSSISLPEVAQAYELEMGLQSLLAYITSRVEEPRGAPLRTHHLIATLPFKRIITTNWDNLLEEALREAGKPFVKVVRDSDIAYTDEEKVLLIKLHGSIEQKDSIVITGDDYYDVLARRPETAALVRSYFSTKTLLFLGFGLADDDFKRQYQEVVRHLGAHKRRAYAVQLDPSPLTVKFWERKNVQIIDADATQFLEALKEQLGFESAPPQPAALVRDVRRRPISTESGPGPIRNRWALLVGVNHYVDPAFPPLRFCVNDVLALKHELEALGYTVVALHDNATEERLLPTRDNIEAELTRLSQVAGSDDLLLAHFACHGKLVNGQPALITRETRAPTLERKALPLAEVERLMRESEARRLVLTLDACHTGVEIGRDLADPAFIRNTYELAEGFALIAASTAQQVAHEWEEKEHGVFTYYLLEGLHGQADRDRKGFVTVDDLKTHVLDALRRWNVQHGGLLQDPTARTEGLGDIILADFRSLATED